MTNFTVTFSYPWVFLLLILAVVFTLIPYFKIKKRYRRTRNRICSIVLHCLVMLLCITVLSGMSFSYDVVNKQNELILLVDASDSNDTMQNEKDDYIRSIIEYAGSDFKVGIVKFGYDQLYVSPLSYNAKEVFNSYLEADEPDATATDIASALTYTSALFENPLTSKIVILSDGLETDGEAKNVIRTIAATGTKVDTVHFPNAVSPEVQIDNVVMPEDSIHKEESFNFQVVVHSNVGEELGNATLSIYDNDEAIESVKFELADGVQSVNCKHTFYEAGLHELRISIQTEQTEIDTLIENNTYISYYYLHDPNKILVIEKDANEANEVCQMLKADEYDVTVLSVESDLDLFPRDIDTLSQYEQVVLVNIANSDLPGGFDVILNEYVYELGGGLLTVGGNNDVNDEGKLVPHAYNRDDMYDTLYQQMLPVQAIDYTPPVALIIIIDRSGSMGSGEGSPLDQAKNGALACLDALESRDYCGVITLETRYNEELRITPVSQRDVIRNSINSIQGNGGGTMFAGAIKLAGRSLMSVDVLSRHIILVTDGQPGDNIEDYGPYVDENLANGITMSVITIGSVPGSQYYDSMASLANRGGGKCYSDSQSNVGQLMYNDMMNEAIEEIAYGEEFTPVIHDRTRAVANIRQEDMPALTGYYGTRLKAGAVAPLMGEFVPIYAQWEYGAGKVGSFMCDLNGTWSVDFITSDTGKLFIHNVVTDLFPMHDIVQSDMNVTFIEDNYSTQVNVFTSYEEGETAQMIVVPISTDAINYYSNKTIPITVADGYTRFTFVIVCPGLYRIDLVKTDVEGNIRSSFTTYKTFSYSQEYNAFLDEEISGSENLAQIASMGNGIAVEEFYSIFDTFTKAIHREFDPRYIFLIVAAVLFLLDIAVRKFKFKWIHELIRERKEKQALMQ